MLIRESIKASGRSALNKYHSVQVHKMKLFLIVVGLALAVAADELIAVNYHETIGIPEATRIKEAEESKISFFSTNTFGTSWSSPGEFPYVVS